MASMLLVPQPVGPTVVFLLAGRIHFVFLGQMLVPMLDGGCSKAFYGTFFHLSLALDVFRGRFLA